MKKKKNKYLHILDLNNSIEYLNKSLIIIFVVNLKKKLIIQYLSYINQCLCN